MCASVNNFVASMIKASNLVLVEEQITYRSLVDSIFCMHDFFKISPKWGVFFWWKLSPIGTHQKTSVMNVITLLITNK